MKNIHYWIWLSRIEKIGSIRMQKLLKKFKTPKGIWNANKEELISVEGIGIELAESILNPIYRLNLEKYENYMKKNNIDIITINSKYYPRKLKELYDKPIVLYIKGNKEILNKFSLAIIGCRDNSKYGEIVGNKITYDLVKRRVITISGLARGIDSIAHKTTLLAGGKTIAVIGSGIDNIYPKENEKLARDIVDNGGTIVSEYIVGSKPERMHFPARNRIISGLSDGVIVVEAKKKSGTMITVDFALEQGKDVYAIPGSILSDNCEGTNELIKQGAKLVRNVDDILEEYQ